MSAKRFLLDTNILSDLVRRPQGRVAERIRLEGEATVCTSIIVAAELRYGAIKSGSRELRRRVGAILSAIEVLPLEPPGDRHYADIRADLARRGTPIGPNDLFIAAQARSSGLVLVTANTHEFHRVNALAVENWLEEEDVSRRDAKTQRKKN